MQKTQINDYGLKVILIAVSNIFSLRRKVRKGKPKDIRAFHCELCALARVSIHHCNTTTATLFEYIHISSMQIFVVGKNILIFNVTPDRNP